MAQDKTQSSRCHFSEEEGAAHQEAAERVHALHEGDEADRSGRVHLEGVGRHQPDPWKKGKKIKPPSIAE